MTRRNRSAKRGLPSLAVLILALAGCAAVDEPAVPPAPEVRLSAASSEKQLAAFEKVWETVRDRHWDPELGGIDWPAAREEFRPRVLAARSQREVRDLLNEMLGRLGQSHFGVFPGRWDAEEFETAAASSDAASSDAAPSDEAASSEPAGDQAATSAPSAAPRADEDDEAAFEAARERAEQEAEELAEEREERDAEDRRGTPGFEVDAVGGEVLVVRVLQGSPADALGVETGWRLLEVAGQSVETVRERAEAEARSDLRALLVKRALQHFASREVGSAVPMLFRDRSDRERELEIRMREPGGELFRLGEQLEMRVEVEHRRLGDVGYLSVNAFGSPILVRRGLEEALEDADELSGFVLDLRGNPGGVGIMASMVAGYFIDDPGLDMGRMMMRESEIRFAVFPRAEVFSGPLAVLVDGGTASTAEILAAGLRDVGRARIFGTRTAGAALPSEIVTLPNGDGFQYALADFESPAGIRIEGVGVEPDVAAPHTREALRAGRDAALESALSWVRTETTRKETP